MLFYLISEHLFTREKITLPKQKKKQTKQQKKG